MDRLAAGLLLIPLADQLIKFLLRRRLGAGTVSLGPLGSVRMVEARIWWLRPRRHPAPAMMWTTWLLAAVVLTAMTILVPACAWFAGMLLGGSLSHAIETSFRGAVSDYVCLRFWPSYALGVLGSYGVGRFWLETLREHPDLVGGRVRINQVVAAAVALVAGGALLARMLTN